MRILIVEDEPTLGKQLKSTLEQTGYAVDLSTDGEDGHYMGSSENYDAVILDLGLPEIDGLAVIRRARAAGDTPILVLSARGTVGDRILGLSEGADDYLPKPFSPAALCEAVATVGSRSGDERRLARETSLRQLTVLQQQ